jgi:very-short-patch-repair endonuclease
MRRSTAEGELAWQIKAEGLPTPEREFRFHETRRWRFDFAWPDRKLAVEVDGGVWTRGRHTRGAGFERDCEKLNEAVLLGWRVLRVTPGMVKLGEAVRVLKVALEVTRTA